MWLPPIVSDIAILGQIAVFIVAGILVGVFEKNASGILLAISGIGYGVTLYLAVFAGPLPQLFGVPSAFLLIFTTALIRFVRNLSKGPPT